MIVVVLNLDVVIGDEQWWMKIRLIGYCGG